MNVPGLQSWLSTAVALQPLAYCPRCMPRDFYGSASWCPCSKGWKVWGVPWIWWIWSRMNLGEFLQRWGELNFGSWWRWCHNFWLDYLQDMTRNLEKRQKTCHTTTIHNLFSLVLFGSHIVWTTYMSPFCWDLLPPSRWNMSLLLLEISVIGQFCSSQMAGRPAIWRNP